MWWGGGVVECWSGGVVEWWSGGVLERSPILLPLPARNERGEGWGEGKAFHPHPSITPSLHHSITPSLHHSTTPSLLAGAGPVFEPLKIGWRRGREHPADA